MVAKLTIGSGWRGGGRCDLRSYCKIEKKSGVFGSGVGVGVGVGSGGCDPRIEVIVELKKKTVVVGTGVGWM